MKHSFITSMTALGVFAMASSASAATVLVAGGDVSLASGWSNGLPSDTNPGTVTVDGIQNSGTFGYGAGGTVLQTAGVVDTAGGSYDGFNMTSGTWDLEGGTIRTRFILANGATINVSGGTIVSTSQQVGANGAAGLLNLSGTGVIDASLSGSVPQFSGGATINFASTWKGSWTQGNYSGTDWRDLVTANPEFKLDGTSVTTGTFDSKFVVTNGGQTLSVVPEPSSAALLGLGGIALILRRRK